MHHYFEAITNTSGDSLVGYFARVIDPATSNTITMSADDNGTPIVTKSGVDNMGSTDDYGNLDFYVVPGTYHLDIYAPNATSFIFRVPNVAMNSTKGDTGPQGISGPANSTFASTAQVAAAPAENLSYMLAGTARAGFFQELPGDYSADVTADPAQAVFIPTAPNPSGSAVVRKRVFSGLLDPLWFGAMGDNVADDSIPLQRCIDMAIRLGTGVDITTCRTGWRITREIVMTGLASVTANFDSVITVDVTGSYPRGYAIVVGTPAVNWSVGRSGGFCVNGLLHIAATSRSVQLSGIYIKGSFHKIDHILAEFFNGRGIHSDSQHDGTAGRYAANSCGSLSLYAVDCSSVGDTFNTFNLLSVQTEEAYHKALRIEGVRIAVQNIHCERISVLTADTSNRNVYIATGNATVMQGYFDCITSGTAPDGTAIAATTMAVQLEGNDSTFTEIQCPGANVYTLSAVRFNLQNLTCANYYQSNPSRQVVLHTPNITSTCSVESGVTFIEPTIATFNPTINAKNIIIEGGAIANDIDFANAIQGNILFKQTAIASLKSTKSPAAGFNPVTFVNCDISTAVGAFQDRARIQGGRVDVVNLVSRAGIEFLSVEFGSFTYTGDISYRTRDCYSTGTVTGWGLPTQPPFYPRGAMTERVGNYDANGMIYANNDGGGGWTKVI